MVRVFLLLTGQYLIGHFIRNRSGSEFVGTDVMEIRSLKDERGLATFFAPLTEYVDVKGSKCPAQQIEVEATAVLSAGNPTVELLEMYNRTITGNIVAAAAPIPGSSNPTSKIVIPGK
jgi:hypothetical protein